MKFRIFSLLTIFCLSLAVAAAQEREFIGYKHKGVVYGETLPNGARDLGGSLLSNENYGVSRFAKSNKIYLWLEKMTTRDREGVPNWVVKDVLEFETLKKNQEFIFGLSSTCTRNGRSSQDLIVLAEMGKGRKSYKVSKAWQVNIRRERFEKASTRGIKCEVAAP